MNESVIISGTHSVNPLGVLRGLAKKGIPVILLDIDPRSMVHYSRYISQRLSCPNPGDSEAAFVQTLMEFGNRLDYKPVIIPTGDAEVIALARHKDTLDTFFQIPIPSAEILDFLVNKKRFFQEIIRRDIPCPKSYFPNTTSEARDIAACIEYPFIIKAAYSHEFIKKFKKKVFLIHSSSEFETAMDLLQSAKLEFFLQEIIPGNAFFLFYSYFNRQSVPLGICGYDKVRQFPKDFGIGTICRSINRYQPTQTAVDFLKMIHYHGIAEPEFKLDPRDGQYKFIEVNTRSVTMTLLAKACGIHVEYITYLDMVRGNIEPLGPASEGVLWIDEISELHYQLSRIRRGLFTFSELSVFFKKKVFACAAIDDPIPFIVALAHFFCERYKSLRNVSTMFGR